MFEKVNPAHPDKVADRIAGAIVDIAYSIAENPKIAVEVLIGHGCCNVIIETSETAISKEEIGNAIRRIAGDVDTNIVIVAQDVHLGKNQNNGFRCGDNGIFKGVPVTLEQMELSLMAREIYKRCPYDGKYVLDAKHNRFIVCQSNLDCDDFSSIYKTDVNPLGYWTGGIDVDTGATNRKLGSDMADSVTGGGLHGKDLSKADVSVNIYAFLKAQETGENVELCCAIGDEYIDGKKYDEIVSIAREYIASVGGFEKFAEWGLV